jgi:trans-aconitate methyltransferase
MRGEQSAELCKPGISARLGPPAYRADDGAAYERFLGRWSGRLAKALIDFAELAADGPVLDVGCGTGSVALELRRRFPDRRVLAVDASAAYLACARDRSGGESIRFEQADAADLPFEAGLLAAAIAQLVLNFMPDPGGRCRRCVASPVPAG